MTAGVASAASTRLLLLPAAMILLGVFLVPVLLFLSQGLHGFRNGQILEGWTLDTLRAFATDRFYWGLVWNSFLLGAMVTLITLLVAYPAALVMLSLRGSAWFPVVAVLVFSPLLTSVIVRSYGWLYVLSDAGVVNWLLLRLGLVEDPLLLVFNWTGTVIAMVHLQVPFMLFPILAVLMRLPPVLREAAQDLGANDLQRWRRVILPLSLPGVLAGAQIVFSTSLSAFATPTILGGGRVHVLPVSIYSSVQGLNWPLGAVQAAVLLALSMLLVGLFTRLLGRPAWTRPGRAA